MTTILTSLNLEEFGLDDRGQRVYLALLGLGIGTVQTIAKKAGLERTGVYGVLRNLQALGLVSETKLGKKRTFVAENPQRLADLQAEKLANIQALLPDLQALWQAPDIRPAVRFYEGIEGMRTVLIDTYTSGIKELCGILSMSDLDATVGRRWMDEMVKQRVGAAVSLRVIRSQSKEVDERWPSDSTALRQLRYSPAGMVFGMTIYTYGNKVALLSTSQENFGMIIESAEFAKTQTQLFEALWQISKPDRKV